jgi:hypothetical protein
VIVEELVSLLGLQIDPNAAGVLQKFNTLVTESFDSVTKFAGAASLAGAATVGAIAAAVTLAANEADKIGDTSQKLGITADSLQRLGFAASASESDFSTLAGGLQILQINAAKAAEGSKELRAAFGGIELKNAAGQIRPANELLADLADKIALLPDNASRTALAVATLGRSGKELVPLLSGGSAGLARLGDEAARLGIVMDDAAIAAGGRFDDAMKRLRASLTGARNAFAAQMVDKFAAALELLQSVVAGSLPFFSALGDVALQVFEGLSPVVFVALSLVRVLGFAVGGVVKFLAATGLLRGALFGLTLAAIAYGVSQLGAVLGGIPAVLALAEVLGALLGAWVANTSAAAAFEATSIGAAVSSAAAWLSVSWPLILLGLLIVGIADEIYGLIVGNDTLISRAIEWSRATTAAGQPVLEMFQAMVSLVFDLTDPAKWRRLVDALAPVSSLLGGTFGLLQAGTSLFAGGASTAVTPGTVAGPQVAPVTGARATGAGRQVTQTNAITINATQMDAQQLAQTLDTHLTTKFQEANGALDGGVR